MLPQVYWLGDAFRYERHHDLASEAGRGVRGVENFLHETSGATIGDWRLPSPNASREMPHLLREAIVPVLLEHGVRPPSCGRRLLDGVAKADLGVRWQRVAHEHVGIRLSLFAEHFDAVVHPARAIPAVLDDSQRPIFKFHDGDGL